MFTLQSFFFAVKTFSYVNKKRRIVEVITKKISVYLKYGSSGFLIHKPLPRKFSPSCFYTRWFSAQKLFSALST